MNCSGHIGINLAEHDWHDDAKTLSVFMHLVSATDEAGVVTTTLSDIQQACGLTRQNVRTALRKLLVTHYLTQQVTHLTTTITICNVDSYKGGKIKGNTVGNTVTNTLKREKKESSKERIRENIPSREKIDSKESTKERSGYDLAFAEEDWRPLMERWLCYKKARRESYKTAQSLKTCYERLRRMAGNDLRTADTIVEESIANNWAGLFAPKTNTRNNGQDNRIDNIGASDSFRGDL